MHVPTILALALAATSAAAAAVSSPVPTPILIQGRDGALSKRNCYSGSNAWSLDVGPYREKAKGLIETACGNKQLGDCEYSPAPEKKCQRICSNIDTNAKIDFQVCLITEEARNLSEADCISGLWKEIHGCDFGGESSYTNWAYLSDPQKGQCNSPVPPATSAGVE